MKKSKDTIKKEILDIAFDIFESDKITIDSSKSEIEKWDSLGNLNFLVTIEEKFELELSENEMISSNSIQDIYQIVCRNLNV